MPVPGQVAQVAAVAVGDVQIEIAVAETGESEELPVSRQAG